MVLVEGRCSSLVRLSPGAEGMVAAAFAPVAAAISVMMRDVSADAFANAFDRTNLSRCGPKNVHCGSETGNSPNTGATGRSAGSCARTTIHPAPATSAVTPATKTLLCFIGHPTLSTLTPNPIMRLLYGKGLFAP